MSNKYMSDNSNMYQTMVEFPAQVTTVWNDKIDESKVIIKSIQNIIVTGLGGSAISGDVAASFFQEEIKVPYIVNRNYSLPKFANENTLVIVCSYSGNTEETISAYKDAVSKKCQIVVVSSGGKLKDLSNSNNNLFVFVPGGYQPRCAIGLMFFSLAKVLNAFRIVNLTDDIVNQLVKVLENQSKLQSNENSLSFSIAKRMIDKFPIIHSTDMLSPVNVRFRCQLAENSKVLGCSGIIPELNHNEIIGWETYSGKNPQAILFQIVDKLDHPRNLLRFGITETILKSSSLEIIQLKSEAETFQIRLFDLIYLTDWISYYLAVLRNVDPTTIININRLKNELSKID